MKKFWKCEDDYIEKYKHFKDGICFECDEIGYIFNTEEKQKYIEKERKIREMEGDLIKCSQLDIAHENGFESYEEYEEYESAEYWM